MDVVWEARDQKVADLVLAHVEGRITFDALTQEFTRLGWSTLYLYEAVVNAETDRKG